MTTLTITRCAPRAFTLLELLVAVAILSVLIVIIAPMLSDDYDFRLRSTAAIVISDVEYAQVMTISNPKDPVVVVFQPDMDTYWLAYASDPTQPIERSGSGDPYLVTLGEGRAWAADGVKFAVADMPDNMLYFNEHGGLKNFISTPFINIRLKAADQQTHVRLAVRPTTGTIDEEFIAPGGAKK